MAYTLRKQGTRWHVYFVTRDGHRFRASTKQTDRVRAKVVADDLYRRHADPTYRAANSTTIEQASRGFLSEAKRSTRATATVEFYGKKLRHVLRVLGPDTVMGRIDTVAVDKYIETRDEEGAEPHTIAKELTALRQVLKRAWRRGEFGDDPRRVMPVAFATKYKPRDRKLTFQEAWQLIGELPEGPARYVAWTIATTGRDADAKRAKGGDWSADGILVRGSKTAGSWRTVPVTPLTAPFAVLAFLGVDDGARVLSGVGSVRHALARACKRLGMPSVSSNDLRRSTTHWLRGEGVQLDVIAGFLGHADTRMVELVYGKRTRAELKAALDKSWINQAGSVDAVDAAEGKFVPRDRIELPTRGFSIRAQGPDLRLEPGGSGEFLDDSWIVSRIIRLEAEADRVRGWRRAVRAALVGDESYVRAFLEAEATQR